MGKGIGCLKSGNKFWVSAVRDIINANTASQISSIQVLCIGITIMGVDISHVGDDFRVPWIIVEVANDNPCRFTL